MPKPLQKTNRILGLDYGEKTIGLAISDENRSIALPLKQIENKGTHNLKHILSEIVSEYHVGAFVWGWPLKLDGSTRPLCEKIQKTAIEISETFHIPFSFVDERFSSKIMTLALSDLSHKKRSNRVDMMAATQILQIALEQIKNAENT